MYPYLSILVVGEKTMSINPDRLPIILFSDYTMKF